MRGTHSRCTGPVGSSAKRGFTLVELLVVVAIIAVLAVMVLAISSRMVRRAQAVRCMGQIREVTTGLTAFTADYQSPPTPDTKKATGWDAIYGDPGGLYHTDFLVAALMGKAGDFSTGTDEVFNAEKANPRGETYWEPEIVEEAKSGVWRKDGRLYDPWGRELMFAINTRPYNRTDGGGQYDSRLMTWGLAEYSDTKPRDQDFVIWSYGKDGKKAEAAAGSDDVISW